MIRRDTFIISEARRLRDDEGNVFASTAQMPDNEIKFYDSSCFCFCFDLLLPSIVQLSIATDHRWNIRL
jgi:hypothetical protein